MGKLFLKGFVLSIVFSMFVITAAFAAEADFSTQLKDKVSNAIILHIGSPKAFVNNVQNYVDEGNLAVCPFIRGARTLVPVRFISESLGAKVDWNGGTRTVLVTLNGTTVELTIGSNIMKVNGTSQTIEVPAEIINERTFIPLRALSEALGKNVFWDGRGIIVISNTAVLDEKTDKTLVDEIENKYTSVMKSIVIPERGTITIEIPANWEYEADASTENSIQFSVNPIDNDSFSCINGMVWNPDDTSSVSLDRIKTVIEQQGDELLPKAVETSLDLKDVTGDYVKGYYFTLEDKSVEADGYKYLTVTDVAADNIVIVSTFLSNELDSADQIAYQRMIKGIVYNKK